MGHEPGADSFRNTSARGPTIVIDAGQQMQTIDGLGYALTNGSAERLMKMSGTARARTLKQSFGSDGDGLGEQPGVFV